MSQNKSPVVLFERELSFFSNSVRIENGCLRASAFLGSNEGYSLFGYRLDAARGYSDFPATRPVPVFLQFIKRALRRNWSVEFLVREGACSFKDGEFVKLENRAFANLDNIELRDDVIRLYPLGQLFNEKASLHFIQDADVLGFVLRPPALVGSNKKHIHSGGIIMRRHIEGAHDYYVGFEVSDSRLLEGIANFMEDRSCNRGYQELHRVFRTEDGRFVVNSEEDMALAIALSRSRPTDDNEQRRTYADIKRENSGFFGFGGDAGPAMMTVGPNGQINIVTIVHELAVIRAAKTAYGKHMQALRKTTKEKKIDK